MTVTGAPDRTATRPAAGGRPAGGRTTRWAGLAGLLAALLAGVVLLVLPAVDQQSVAEPGIRTLDQAWPDARRLEIPASLPDGPAYSPGYLFDDGASVGTAPSPDGTSVRLLLRSADGSLRQLRRLPLDVAPQYGGFTVADGLLAWAESTTDADGGGRTELWLADLGQAGEPRRLTADTGDVVFFNSAYDLVLAEGRLHWAAVAPGEETATEARSVPVTGGEVAVRTEPGAWARSTWPWLVSAGTGESGPIQLLDLAARKRIEVDATGTELVSCSPAWCRVLVLGGDGPGRIDLMRPDGAQRRQVAAGAASASIIDVAVLDRFEVLSLADAQRTAAGNQQLLLYDLTDEQVVTVAEGIGMVLCRGGMLWWSTMTGGEIAGWRALDLRSLG